MTSEKLRQLLSLSKEISQSAALTAQLISEIEGRRPAALFTSLTAMLDLITLRDVGVTDTTAALYFVPSLITYTRIYESPEVSICLFAMAKGTGLPLHDHPEMAVVTRMLTGRVKFRQADLLQRKDERLFTYCEKDIGDMRAPAVLALTPAMCNLHQFLAMENTVFMDIFIPNYSEMRDVTYFLEISPNTVCSLQSALLNFRQVQYSGAKLEDEMEAG